MLGSALVLTAETTSLAEFYACFGVRGGASM
jgi:hypothetical protein